MCSTCTWTRCRPRPAGATTRTCCAWHGERAIGLGACDIKGAAACLLAAAATIARRRWRCCSAATRKPMTRAASLHSWPRITASTKRSSPSRRRREAVLAHRGISLGPACTFAASAGHASAADALRAQRPAPGHALGREGAGLRRVAGACALRRTYRAALQHRAHRGRHQGQHDRAYGRSCASASGRCPRRTRTQLHAQLRALLPRRRRWRPTRKRFRGPVLPAGDVAGAEARRLAARDLADELGLPIGNAVDFWTEAALFSAGRLYRAGVRAGRHRPGPHRRRMGRARRNWTTVADSYLIASWEARAMD